MKRHLIFIFIVLYNSLTFSQTKSINIEMTMLDAKKSFLIKQTIEYQNNSNDTLHEIVLLDWNHAYSQRNTPLGKRFLENYNKRFYFASKSSRGGTDIKSICLDNLNLTWQRHEEAIDQITVDLPFSLPPNGTIKINFTYNIKLPDDKFTGYGVTNNTYQLQNFYLITAAYHNGWQAKSNLNIDNINHPPTKVILKVQYPNQYHLASNLNNYSKYIYKGHNITGIKLYFHKREFKTFDLDYLKITTDIKGNISNKQAGKLLNRQILFIQKYLGLIPQEKLLLTQQQYNKNPLYGFNQLPKFLSPFSNEFSWDLKVLKTLTNEYIEILLATHNIKKDWLSESITPFIMYHYINTYYPNEKLIGNISKIWGIKFYHISDLPFNERYFIASQYNLQQNYDQDLKTPIIDLTNYNRLVGQPFKGLNLLLYFEDFFTKPTINSYIKETFNRTQQEQSNSDFFLAKVKPIAPPLMQNYIEQVYHDAPRLDYKLKQIRTVDDSIKIKLVNLETMQTPVKLVGLTNDSIVSKYWLTPNSKKNYFTLPFKGEDYWHLDPQKHLPDVNHNNNYSATNNKFLNKPISLRWMTDVDNEKKNQMFIDPNVYYYTYYGFTISSTFHNNSMFTKKWSINLNPTLGVNQQSLTGSANIRYWNYLDHKHLNSIKFGVFTKYFHYKKDLAYFSLSTYGNLFFKRLNFRNSRYRSLNASYNLVYREPDPTPLFTNTIDQYSVFNLNYNYSKPGVIELFFYSLNLELSRYFSKLYATILFRRQISNSRQFEARLFNGIFPYNKMPEDDFFSFGVNRANDYLFRYNYFTDIESSGFFSQQYIRHDAGFKAIMPIKYANHWISTINSSLNIWRWIELYGDIGLIKNKQKPLFFAHDKGIRLNFADSLLEIYFPVHSNNGWEINQPNYARKIRFVFTTSLKTLTNFIKRGVL